MADETTGVMPTEGGENPQTEAQSTETATNGQAGATPDIAQLQAQMAQMQDALKRANREAADRRKKLDEFEAAETKRKEAELSETEKLSRRLAEAEKRAQDAELQILRREIGAKYNVPSALIDRLRGSDAEELEADAKELVAAIPKPSAPNINAVAGNGKPAATLPPGFTEEALRDQAVRLGVNPETYIAQFRR